MANLVLGVFSERDNAEEAIGELEAEGYNPKDISIMMRGRSEVGEISDSTGARNVVNRTLGGAATGIVLGGLAGLVASFVIPGLGSIFIGGPVAAALGLTGAAATTASGATTGALAGGIIGALTSVFGLSREEARIYEDRFNKGGILIAVPARIGEEQEVEDIMNDFNADNIKIIESSEGRRREEEISSRRYGAAQFSEIRPKRKAGSGGRTTRIRRRRTAG